MGKLWKTKIWPFLKSRAATFLTLLGIIGVGLVGWAFVLRHWALFQPTNAATAWPALDAIADAVTALCTVGIATFALRGLRSIRIARDEIIHRASRSATGMFWRHLSVA